MKHNMNRVVSIVALLMFAISTWAEQKVTIMVNPTEGGGTVTASKATAGQTCTLTVKPVSGKYLTSLKALTMVASDAIQAPMRRTDDIVIDEGEEIAITSDASADPSSETTHTFTMPNDANLNVVVLAMFESRISISEATITLDQTVFTYDGTEKKPAVSKVTLDGVDLAANEYSVEYVNNINAGTGAIVQVNGLRQYTGSTSTTFTILPPLDISYTGNNRWATYYCSLNLKVPEGLTAYRVSSVNEMTGEVNVQAIDYIPANRAILLQRAEGGAASGYTSELYDGTLATNIYSELWGSNEETDVAELDEGTTYVLYNDAFVKTASGKIPARRGYLRLYMPQAPQLNIVIEDEESATGVNDVRSKMAEVGGGYYNLLGRKLSGKPSKNGLYIMNGKKVVVNNK